MNFTITCVVEDPDSPDHDALLPILATAQAGAISSRSTAAWRAAANVKGIILHWIGDWADPPNQIGFTVVDLTGPEPRL